MKIQALVVLVSVAAFTVIPAVAQSSLELEGDADLSAASVSIRGKDALQLTNVEVAGKLVNMELQWDPTEGNFKVLSAERKEPGGFTCITEDYLGKEGGYDGTVATFVVKQIPSSRSVEIKILPKAERNFSNPKFEYERISLVQDKRELGLTRSVASAGASTALITPSSSWTENHPTTIPAGVEKTALVERLPVWFDVNQPISSVIVNLTGMKPTRLACR